MFGLLEKTLVHIVVKGNLIVTDAAGEHHSYGDGSGERVHVCFHSRRAERQVALDPALKLGEVYMEGGFELVEGDMYQLLAILFKNAGETAEKEPWMRLFNFVRTLTKRFNQLNTLKRAKNNIRHHYDLSAKLYDLFLDQDRQYSCAYFETETSSLEEAQLAKKRHLAAKLAIRPGDRVLDIGCGWGGLCLYLARVVGADVTGVTLSQEQHKIANERAIQAGLGEHCRFLLQDYRSLDKKFDKIVSVGMFEHVGIGHFKEYFAKVQQLLKPDGLFVLHSIGRNGIPGATNPFIAKYIFPGGYIPALSEVIPVIEKSGLVMSDIEILRRHYADTLMFWRQAFMNKREAAKALYDERFCRLWEFYLAASESAFRWQNMMVFQIQLSHNQEVAPLTRSYIEREEAHLIELEKEAYAAEKGVAQF